MNTSKSSPIIIAGAGPVGLVLALRLGHWGIPCVVLEADAQVSRDLRASTFHPPTLDMLDEYGITPELIQQGLIAPTWQVRMHATGEFAQFDLSVLQGETAHPYRLQCEQWRLSELLLAQIARDLPHVQVRMGHPLVSFEQFEDHVQVQFTTPEGQAQSMRGAFLVGADGGRSQVRKQLDLSFEGHTFPETTILATTHFPFHEHLPQLAYINYCWSASGTFSLLRLKHLWRVSLYPDDGQSMEEAVGMASVRSNSSASPPVRPRSRCWRCGLTASTSGWCNSTWWAGWYWSATPPTSTAPAAAWA